MFVPRNLCHFISQDLNLCDFWIWNAFEVIFNTTSHSRMCSLKTSIKRAFGKIKTEEIDKPCAHHFVNGLKW